MRQPRRQQGVTLVEVLIAIVVMAIGLIGVAAMQTAAISNNQMAFEYTQVATAAQNMAERMRANKEGLGNGYYQRGVGAATPANPPVNCALPTAVCDLEQQAKWDISSWYASLASGVNFANVPSNGSANLPGVKIAISCETVCEQNNIRTITVYWDSRRTGDADGFNCDPDTADDLACFRLPVVP